MFFWVLFKLPRQYLNVLTSISRFMIASSNSSKEFLKFWSDKEVFAYIKSQDNRWLYENDKNLKSQSHYASQYCEYPWLSLTVMADGSVVPCTQVSNSELVLGNVNETPLEEIWNGDKYKKLREMHVTGKFPKGHKCNEKCDMKKLYQYLS